MFKFFKKKEKEVLDCLGYYETKQYNSLNNALVYADNTLILKDDFKSVYGRVFKGTLFLFTLVDDETGFDKTTVKYEAISNLVNEKLEDNEHDSLVNIIVFKHKNDETLKIAKEVPVNTQTEFNHVLVFNGKDVRLEFFRPVPKFYKLYKNFCEAVYFDLGAFDPKKD
jgi:hypothetical protein